MLVKFIYVGVKLLIAHHMPSGTLEPSAGRRVG